VLPGEPEEQRRAERMANGIPPPQHPRDASIATARSVGMNDHAIRELTDGAA
jgi:LDH2 family malate/lactate/ureidoglycolate dehydrogenase